MRFATRSTAVALAAWIAGASTASAEPADPAAPPVDVREAAASARRAAEEAQRELDDALRAFKRAGTHAARRAEEAEQAEVKVRELEAASEAEAAAAREAELEAKRAAREAEQRAANADARAQEAERKADEALRRVEELEARFGYDRTGVYVGAGVYYAPEVFDEGGGVVAKSSRGAMARVGYRFHRYVAFEARFDYLEEFELRAGTARGELDAYTITGNIRVFPYPKRLQPWLSVGGGAIVSKFDAKFDDGRKIRTLGRETDPIFRFGAGFDFYLTSYLVLNIEAAMNLVADQRDWVDYGQLGAGLDFRF